MAALDESVLCRMEDSQGSKERTQVVLESDYRTERVEWLKTQLQGNQEAKNWKIKCKDVLELLQSRFPTVLPYEAGKIVKQAFPFVKRQSYRQSNGKYEYHYYRLQIIPNNTSDVQVQFLHVSQLEECLQEKEKELREKEKELDKFSGDLHMSVKKVRILEKQKKTLAAIVTELEENRERTNRKGEAASECEDMDLIRGIDYIPESKMFPIKNEAVAIGSGSYGTCELMMWKNIKVCVKKFVKKTTKEDLQKEAVILKRLQQSLFVPVLLGINTESKPYHIVTKFHSAANDSSLTLHKATNNITMSKRKWVRILHRCALGLQSIHALGFIHNDLHMKNIVLDRMDGHVQPIIIDFGKACRQGHGRCRKVPDVDLYRHLYPWVAPETITGHAKESESSDVYSFGYIMLKVNRIARIDGLNEVVTLCQSNRKQRPDIETVIGLINSIVNELSFQS